MKARAGADWTLIVLAGGRGRRLGGADKSTIDIGGRSTLAHVLAPVPPEVPVVVSGAPQPTPRPVRFRPEEPPGGGPVAGLVAALAEVTTSTTAVVAVDMPWATTVATRLVTVLDASAHDVVVPTTVDGHRQPLCAVWATAALRAALASWGSGRDRSMRELLATVRVAEVALDAEDSADLADIDTRDDVSRARARTRLPRLAGADHEGPEPTNRSDHMDEWIDAVRSELGLDATVDVDAILDIARVAAHNVARPAAPITTYLVGIAVAGGADLAETRRRVEALAAGWPAPA